MITWITHADIDLTSTSVLLWTFDILAAPKLLWIASLYSQRRLRHGIDTGLVRRLPRDLWEGAFSR